METLADGTVVFTESDLSDDERFALGLVRAVLVQEWMRDVKTAGKRVPETDHERARYQEEVGFLAYFLQWFAVEFKKPFPGEVKDWSMRYRAGLDALADKGLVAELRKGDVSFPGASTTSEFWFPRVVRMDRLRPAAVVLKEG